MKQAGFKLIIFTLAVAFTGMIAITYEQFRRYETARQKSFSSELQHEHAVLEIISQPATMAAARLTRLLNFSKPLKQADLSAIKTSLIKHFGNEARFIVADSELNEFVSFGFSENDVSNWLQIFQVFPTFISQDGGSLSSPQLIEMLIKTLGQHFSPGHMANFLSIFENKFGEDFGMVVFGIGVNEKMRKIFKVRLSSPATGESMPPNIFCHILAFVPQKVYSSRKWLSENVDLLAGKDKEAISGSKEELVNFLQKTGREKAAVRLAELMQKSSSGFFEENSDGFIFDKFTDETKPADDFRILLIQSKKADRSMVIAIFITAVILLLFVIIILIFANNEQRQLFLRMQLATHFLVLSLLAASVPMLALGIQVFSQWQNLDLQDENMLFTELEAKIKNLENEYSLQTGDLLTAINSFQLFCKEMPEFIVSEVKKRAQVLKPFSTTQIFVSDRSGKIEVLNVGTVASEFAAMDDSTRFLSILVKFVQQSLKFGGKSDQMDMKEGVLIETATEALGTDNMYTLALQQNQLLTFKMLHGAIWALTIFQNDPLGIPERLYLHIIHRSSFQKTMINKWQQRFDGNIPEYVFSSLNVGFFEKKASVWLEHIPELAAMTRALNNGGGQIKTKFQRGEKTFYCAGRRLKAFDWACLAIKEAAPTGGFFDRSLLVISMIMGYVLLIMGFAGYYFNQIFIQPVRRLSKGVYEMAQGNYDLRIETATDDEIGRMCQSFNHMGTSLKEKEFLSRFLSDIAMDAINGKLSERATRVSGTVLFSDIRDFTTITEQNEPEEVVEMLNDYMTVMEEAIESESGTIEKFIGDAIMAVFLPAIGLQNPVIRATAAAEKMQTALAELNAKRSEKGQFAISNGVGIATGQLLMGVMGNEQGRRDFTVTGITVRLAATMEKYSRKARSRKIILCPHSAETAAGAGIKTFKMKDGNAFELA